MSSSDRERMRNCESLEFPIKTEIEDSFPHAAVKLENNDFLGLIDDGSLFMDPDIKFKAEVGIEFKAEPEIEIKAEPEIEFKAEPEIEFKAEPEIFELSEGGRKYSFDCDASVSEEDLQFSKREFNKEELIVKTGVKDGYCIHLGSSRKEETGNRRGRGKEFLRNEDQIENSGCKKPLFQESDSKTHADVDMRENSSICGNYEKQFSAEVYPNTGGQFRCREWGKIFSKQSDLKAHYETHTRRSFRPFKCSDCDKAFSQKGDLKKHSRIHTGEKPFKCTVCDKSFSREDNLTTHYRIHTGEKPFKCNGCDKAFSDRSALATHHRIHTGEKPFKCSVCNKAFSKRSNLTKHYRIHTGEKLFKCNVCDKAFSDKSNLSTHYKIHKEEKPSKCSNCNMIFTKKSNLSRHTKICAGENV